MEDIPYPSDRLKWMSRMLQDLLRVDDRWYTADLKDTEGDPLRKTLVLRCRGRVDDASWLFLQRFLRSWAEQNDCATKNIRRFQGHVELDLYIKYLNRETDYSPYEELPATEKRWREGNRRLGASR